MYYADLTKMECIICNYSICYTCINTPNTCLSCFKGTDLLKPATNLNLTILFNQTCINSTSCPAQYYIEYGLSVPQCLACVSPCK